MNQAIREINEAINAAKIDLNLCLSLNPRHKRAVKEARDDLETLISERVNFWRDTFRSDPFENECHYISDPYCLYEDYGYRFRAPTKAEIKQILETLDTLYPGWDSRSAEPFYATLQANFPERVKKAKKSKAVKRGVGCISIILFAIFLCIILLAAGRH